MLHLSQMCCNAARDSTDIKYATHCQWKLDTKTDFCADKGTAMQDTCIDCITVFQTYSDSSCPRVASDSTQFAIDLQQHILLQLSSEICLMPTCSRSIHNEPATNTDSSCNNVIPSSAPLLRLLLITAGPTTASRRCKPLLQHCYQSHTACHSQATLGSSCMLSSAVLHSSC